MKKNKLPALLLSSVIMAGAVTSCNGNVAEQTAATTETTETTETTTVATTEETEPPADIEGYKELPVEEVKDEDDGKILIYSYNAEFESLLSQYTGLTSDEYEIVTLSDSDGLYTDTLDSLFEEGTEAPDIFVCDAAYAKKYIEAGYALPINEIGIDYSECNYMFDYSLRFASDDEDVIRALAWKVCPAGVFYERTVAEEYLGTSDPEELADSFATWDAVLESARKVNEASGGSAKLVSGYGETLEAYLFSRGSGWIKDGKFNVDPQAEAYYDFAKTLYDEELIFYAEPWSSSWRAGMSDRSVVSYWGSLQYARYQLALNPGEWTTVNPTAGEWGVTSAPEGYCSGGCWVMVSKYCDKKATAADILRAICIDEDNLKEMVNKGEFVNNIKLMTLASADDKFALEWLGGQNPYTILLNSALEADASKIVTGEDDFNWYFNASVGSYCEGAFESIDDAEASFEEQARGYGLLD